MDDLFFSGGTDPVHIDASALHDVEALSRIAFPEKVVTLRQVFRQGKRRHGGDVRGGHAHEKLATAQRVFGHRPFEAHPIERHARTLSPAPFVVPQKIHNPGVVRLRLCAINWREAAHGAHWFRA